MNRGPFAGDRSPWRRAFGLVALLTFVLCSPAHAAVPDPALVESMTLGSRTSLASVSPGVGQGILSDGFAERQMYTSQSGKVVGDNRRASREPGEPSLGGKRGGHSLWMSFRASADGALTLTTAGSSFDTLLAVYRVRPNTLPLTSRFEDLIPLVQGDDEDEDHQTSKLTFGVDLGVEYAVVVDGYGGATGGAELAWTYEPRSMVSPTVIALSPSQSVPEGSRASLSVEVKYAGNAEYQWFRGKQEIDGARSPVLVIDSFGRGDVGRYQVRVEAEDVDVFSNWVELQISSEEAGGGVAADKLYDALETPLRAWLGGGAQVQSGMSMRRTAASLQAGIGVVRGVSGSQVFSTSSATRDPDEPVHCGQVGGASYWFAYEAAAAGTLRFDAAGTGYPALLAAYTYTPPLEAYSQLVPIGCSVSGQGIPAPMVEFPVVAGGVYLVVLEGLAGARGTAQLNYQFTQATAAIPPTLTGILPDRFVAEGDALVLEAPVAGTSPLAFVWYRDAIRLDGVSGARLELPAVGLSQSGGYRFEVSNRAGSATSAVSRVTVVRAPGVTLPEATKRVIVGSSILVRPVYEGGDPRSQQWFRGLDPIPGSTLPELSLNGLQLQDSGIYRVEVTDPLGRRATAQVVLEVVPVPQGRVVGPAGPVKVGVPVVLGVAFEGTSVLAVRWYRNNEEIAGASGAELRLASVASGDSGEYRVVVDTEFGAITSAGLTLRVMEPVSWQRLPSGMEALPGDRLVLEAAASGTSPLRWQWFRGGRLLPGAVGPTLVLESLGESGFGEYRVSVSNLVSQITSDSIVIERAQPPRIISGPGSIRVGLRGTARFQVVVEAGPLGGVRWLKDGQVLEGAGGLELVVTDCDLASAGLYQAEVTNRVGSLRSGMARLEVLERTAIRRDRSSGAMTLMVPVPPGGPFTVESAESLGGPWQGVADGVGNERGLYELAGASGSGRLRLFRVRVSEPAGTRANP
jgi:hypothetical protein